MAFVFCRRLDAKFDNPILSPLKYAYSTISDLQNFAMGSLRCFISCEDSDLNFSIISLSGNGGNASKGIIEELNKLFPKEDFHLHNVLVAPHTASMTIYGRIKRARLDYDVSFLSKLKVRMLREIQRLCFETESFKGGMNNCTLFLFKKLMKERGIRDRKLTDDEWNYQMIMWKLFVEEYRNNSSSLLDSFIEDLRFTPEQKIRYWLQNNEEDVASILLEQMDTVSVEDCEKCATNIAKQLCGLVNEKGKDIPSSDLDKYRAIRLQHALIAYVRPIEEVYQEECQLLSDLFVTCAEDNAASALLQVLEPLKRGSIKKIKCVWTALQHNATEEEPVNSAMCSHCDANFERRLTDILCSYIVTPLSSPSSVMCWSLDRNTTTTTTTSNTVATTTTTECKDCGGSSLMKERDDGVSIAVSEEDVDECVCEGEEEVGDGVVLIGAMSQINEDYYC